jgi:hypothetical protein
MPQICDMGPKALLPIRRKACLRFFRPEKPTASAGFEPENLGTRGQHARPPKPLRVTFTFNYVDMSIRVVYQLKSITVCNNS